MKKSIYSSDQEALQVLLRQVRKESGLSQKQLAEKLGTLQTIVSNYEIGERRLDVLELRQICTALGMSFADFMDRLEKMISQDTDETMSDQNVSEAPSTFNCASQDPQDDENRIVNVEGHIPTEQESGALMPNERRSEEMLEEQLVEERQFFVEMLPQWLRDHTGHIAVIKGRKLLGFFANFEEAYLQSNQQYGHERFLVREVTAEPRRVRAFGRTLLIGGNLTGPSTAAEHW